MNLLDEATDTVECPSCTVDGIITADDCSVCGTTRWLGVLADGRRVNPVTGRCVA